MLPQSHPLSSSRSALRSGSLIAGVAAVLAAGPVDAITRTVTSCTDTGPGDTGNLRNTIAAAGDGDTVDLAGLTCVGSKITLLLGQITIGVPSLTVQGPTQLGNPGPILTIEGLSNGQQGMLRHTGTGTLYVYNLILERGYVTANTGTATGGCIASSGDVVLRQVRLDQCRASTQTGKAYGGALYARLGLAASYDSITDNTATAAAGTAVAGGLFIKDGGLQLSYSTISGNSAASTAATHGNDGAAYVVGNSTIKASTISGNTAHAHVGGLFFGGAATTLVIQDSTVSGNVATLGPVGGVMASVASVALLNSTIAFNTAGSGSFGGGNAYSPGFAVTGGTVQLQSSLLANNRYGTPATDMDFSKGAATLTGANNLIRSAPVVPPGTIVGCPWLGPLRNNGGRSNTHALMSHSLGIDAGTNAANTLEDQRGGPTDIFLGAGLPFPRTLGAATDIGAYEVNPVDVVFNSGFDACP